MNVQVNLKYYKNSSHSHHQKLFYTYCFKKKRCEH